MTQKHASQQGSNAHKRKDTDAAIIQLASIVESSGDAIIGKTPQGVITSWNNSAEKLFGYTADEIIGKSISLIIPPEHQKELPEILARIAIGETVQHYETTRVRKDGTYIEVSVTVSPIRDSKGRVIAASTIVHDVTEQKRMIEELAIRSHELEGSNEELATRSRELERSNEELATRSRELEGSVEELATRSHELEGSVEELATRSHELEGSNEELATRSRELEGSNEELATRSHELEGSVEELATRSHELEGSNEELATRSRELEGSVEELATRSRELEGSNEELATRTHELEGSVEELATRSHELEGSNEELATRSRELERSNQELATRSHELEHSNQELATRTHELERSVKELATRSHELEGSNEELATRSRELERSNQKLATRSRELGRSNQELIALNSDLEEANRARSQFLSTMSHELRTPLASIIGFSQMLLDDAEIANLNRQQQNDLKRILRNGKHLLSLINDVLDLTKIDAGRMIVQYSQLDVKELLTSVVEETQSIAIAQHLILRAEVDEGITSLESNPLKIRQVLLNLVSNALKFTEQGEVVVSARRVISSDQQAECLVIAVKDSGIGIPEDIQEHIFEAFYQADGTYTRKSGGTGLGLSIVSQLTTLLGGTIAVKSAPGQGSTFTVLLPVKAVHQHIEQAPPRLHLVHQLETGGISPPADDIPPAISATPMAVLANGVATDRKNNLILAVDDNPDIIVLIKAALKGTIYRVVGLQDALKAMELAQELHPCAIMLDVMMPKLNGWQLLNQLKENPATASIPVMMITVLSEPTTGYVLGADAYLIKPFKTNVLLNTLKNLMALQKDQSQAGEREAQRV